MKVVIEQTAANVDQVKVVAQQTATDVDQMKRLLSNLTSVDDRALHTFSGNELRKGIHKWLSPPDPSTNHNIACATYHKKPASWFFQGGMFREWKSTGSLLWIHGKRLSCCHSDLTPPNTIFHGSWLGQERSLVCSFSKYLA